MGRTTTVEQTVGASRLQVRRRARTGRGPRCASLAPRSPYASLASLGGVTIHRPSHIKWFDGFSFPGSLDTGHPRPRCSHLLGLERGLFPFFGDGVAGGTTGGPLPYMARSIIRRARSAAIQPCVLRTLRRNSSSAEIASAGGSNPRRLGLGWSAITTDH